MKIRIASLLLLLIANFLQAQLYQGPAQGLSGAGVLVNTNTFTEAKISSPNEKKVFNKFTYTENSAIIPELNALESVQQVYVEDTSVRNPLDSAVQPLTLKSFNGIVETNSIPPDPYIAVGPRHILSQVNTAFAISDKNGNRLKTIDATNWYQSALASVGPFDPKVIYDHYAKRWVMVWLDTDAGTQRGNLLISVSDDDDPTGSWYNWVVPSTVNGTTPSNNWSDYQGVGYDKDAIYITSNQFDFNTAGNTFQYSKIRIIPKTALYANTGAAFPFFDIWDIRNPLNSQRIFSLRPSRSYSDTSAFYLVHLLNGTSNGAYLYKLENVTTTPTMTGYGVSIKTYTITNTANQLGGGSPALEAGGGSLRNEPVIKDGRIHFVHAVNNPTYPGYSALHYMQINLATMKTVEDVIYGANKYYFIYPALAVDKNNNVALTYSRSGDSAYAGAYYTAKLANTTNFIPSVTMQHGKANYVKTFGGTRNRWGDYTGMWLDPENDMSIWAFAEFVAGTNKWGTWTTELRLEPYSGQKLIAFSNALQFKPTEVGKTSDTASFVLSNYGQVAARIDSLVLASGQYKVKTSKPLPLSLNTFDSVVVSVVLNPVSAGVHTDSLIFYTTDGTIRSLPVTGKGYVIVAAQEKKLYGISGAGQLVAIDKAVAGNSVIGASNFSIIAGLAIHPKTKVLYGVRNNESGLGEIVRFNAQTGEAFTHSVMPIQTLTSIAFDTAGTLYAATRAGGLYLYNMETAQATLLSTCKTNLSSIAFHPKTNVLWGSVHKALVAGRDRIVKINPLTGDTVLVGPTGYTVLTPAIAFDESGTLYGIKGTGSAPSDLFRIDTTNGVGTLVGSIGINGVTSLGYLATGSSSVTKSNSDRPAAFALQQNYPNPFNPETIIQYSLAENATVSLRIYNVLGERVAVLDAGDRSAGTYTVHFDARSHGYLSSGIYFYELIAEHAKGTYRDIRKMNILK